MNISHQLWRQAILQADATIGDAIASLNKSALKIVMVVDQEAKLEGIISDGDIRRGLLSGLDLNSPLLGVVNRSPLVATVDLDREFVKQLMEANKIYQIPVLDNQRHIVDLHLWNQIDKQPTRQNLMVIMAGGVGVRLRPHTENCPKPMLPLAGKPMLEHIIERAKLEGFTRFIISIHYLGHMIESYFRNGQHLDVQIDYLREDHPLGTAGALGFLSPLPDVPFVVTNGDVITDIKYGELLDFHIRHSATATMAVRVHEWQHPFGVVQTNGVNIIGFEEKPIYRSHINAGVYILNPCALNYLPKDIPCDMPTLFESLQANSFLTVAYPMHEPWLDVGRPDDLAIANAQLK